jgi:hypothetical protein
VRRLGSRAETISHHKLLRIGELYIWHLLRQGCSWKIEYVMIWRYVGCIQAVESFQVLNDGRMKILDGFRCEYKLVRYNGGVGG